MMQHPSPETLAHEFWVGTASRTPFPGISSALSPWLPLALVKLPQLNAQMIGQWLERGISSHHWRDCVGAGRTLPTRPA